MAGETLSQQAENSNGDQAERIDDIRCKEKRVKDLERELNTVRSRHGIKTKEPEFDKYDSYDFIEPVDKLKLVKYVLFAGSQYGDMVEAEFDGYVLEGAGHIIREVIGHFNQLTGWASKDNRDA